MVAVMQLGLYELITGSIHFALLRPLQLILMSLCMLVPVCYTIGVRLGEFAQTSNGYRTLKVRSYWTLSSIAMVLVLTGGIRLASKAGESGYTVTGHLFLLYLIIANTLNVLSMEGRIGMEKQTKRTRIPLMFLIGSFIFFVIFATHATLTGIPSIYLLLLLSTLLCATCTSHFALRFLARLGSQTVSFNRDFFYSSFMLIVIGAYLILVGLLGKLVSLVGGNIQVFFSVITAGVVLIIFFKLITSMRVKEQIRSFTDSSLFRERYDYRAVWSKFSEDISIHLERDALSEAILKAVTEILRIKKAELLVVDNQRSKLTFSRADDAPTGDFALHLKHEFCDWLWRLGRPTDLRKAAKNNDHSEQFQSVTDFLLARQTPVCLPLATQKGLAGVLVLGEKTSGKRFTAEDYNLLETLANHSAIALENINAQQNLREAKKMESFYKVTSFILHDLKNIASALAMLSQNAEKHVQDPEFQQSLTKALASTVGKMKAILAKLSFERKPPEFDFCSVRIDDLIRCCLQDLKITPNVSVQMELKPIPAVVSDPQQIQKVVVNLVLNAIEAMPGGGTLTIRTDCRPGHSIQHDLNGLKEKDLVEIQVQDTGIGMNQKFIEQKLFKPFATTKPHGLGIGLYHCKEIIHALGGLIKVTSAKEHGTTFSVFLPAQDEIQSKETFQGTAVAN